MKQRNKRGWFKTIIWGFILCIIMLFIAALMVKMGGNSVAESANDILNRLWWPISVIRLIVYVLIAYVISRKVLMYKFLYSISYERTLHCVGNNVGEDLLAKRANAQRQVYKEILRNPHIVMGIFAVFDVCTLQTPYLLR